MRVFVDTSAFFALLDRDDANHAAAAGIWQGMLQADQDLWTHNYVLLETIALAQRRLGLPAVRALQDDILPLLEILWVDENLHKTAVATLLASRRKAVSLVDRVSFAVMRKLGLDTAFAFDEDFTQEGYHLCTSA